MNASAYCLDNSGNITIYVKNTALTLNHVQVRDHTCPNELPKECRLAEIINKKCSKVKNQRSKHKDTAEFNLKCNEVKEILDSSDCISGIIFDDSIRGKERVALSICKDSNGHGSVSVRAKNNNAPWTNYFFLEDGKEISHQ